MRNLRTILALIAFCLSVPLAAGISYGSSDLNGSDEVLFTVRQTLPGTVSYRPFFTQKS